MHEIRAVHRWISVTCNCPFRTTAQQSSGGEHIDLRNHIPGTNLVQNEYSEIGPSDEGIDGPVVDAVYEEPGAKPEGPEAEYVDPSNTPKEPEAVYVSP